MPQFTTPDGGTLVYEIAGDGPPLVLTPGGREGRRVLDPLRDTLTPHFTVLTWDRRNTGAASLCLDGTRSEQAIWSRDLVDLVRGLDFGPAWIAGGSAGCRVSLNAVLRDPGIARGLVLWSASGGAYGSQFLGFSYHVPYIMAAQAGGMEAVSRTPHFADRIAARAENRAILMAQDPARFIATLRSWNRSFYPREGEPLAGIEGDLATIALPTLIFTGNDDIHPAEASTALARLIAGADLVDSPWSGDTFMDRLTGRVSGGVFALYPQLTPTIVDFVRRAPAPAAPPSPHPA